MTHVRGRRSGSSRPASAASARPAADRLHGRRGRPGPAGRRRRGAAGTGRAGGRRPADSRRHDVDPAGRDLAGFADVVDAVGGVEVDVPEPVRDRAAGLEILRPGRQTVDGLTALALVRSRHPEHLVDGVWTPAPPDPEGRALGRRLGARRVRESRSLIRCPTLASAGPGVGGLRRPHPGRRHVAHRSPRARGDRTCHGSTCCRRRSSTRRATVAGPPQRPPPHWRPPGCTAAREPPGQAKLTPISEPIE